MQTQILIFGRHLENSKEIFNALEQFENWAITAITDVEIALEKMHRQKINIVIFTKDVQAADENKLRKIGTILNEEIIFLHHSNHPSFRQRLVSLINKQRLEQPNYAVTDSILRNVFLSPN